MNVLLIRANRNDADERALADLGIDSTIDPYLEISSSGNISGAKRMLSVLKNAAHKPADTTWLVITSTNALQYFETLLEPNDLDSIFESGSNVNFAAIGNQTAMQLFARGAMHVLQPNYANAQSLADLLSQTPAGTVVIPSSSIAMATLDNQLSQAGFEVISEVVYDTNAVSKPPSSVPRVSTQEFDAVLLRSPSAARAFHRFNGDTKIKVICAGETTALQARQLGLNVVAVSENPSPELVAQTILENLGRRK